MSIRLIHENEHLTCEISGVTFHYRRPTQAALSALRDKNTSRGKLDDEAFAEEMLRHCVFNWDGDIAVDDTTGSALFDPALLAALPMKVKASLVETITEQVDGKHTKVDPT